MLAIENIRAISNSAEILSRFHFPTTVVHPAKNADVNENIYPMPGEFPGLEGFSRSEKFIRAKFHGACPELPEQGSDL